MKPWIKSYLLYAIIAAIIIGYGEIIKLNVEENKETYDASVHVHWQDQIDTEFINVVMLITTIFAIIGLIIGLVMCCWF